MELKKIIPVHLVSSCIGLFLILMLPVISFGQAKHLPAEKDSIEIFLSVKKAIDRTGTWMRTHWELMAIESELGKYRRKTSEKALNDISDWLGKRTVITGEDKESQYLKAKYNYVLKFDNNIRSLIKELKFIGNERVEFHCSDVWIPIEFAQKDGQLVFILTNIATTRIFNTLRTTAKERAAKIGNSMVLPAIKYFDSNFRNMGIPYYGIMISYGTDDFSKERLAPKREAEILAFIFSQGASSKFIAGEITDDEFVGISEIFLQDHLMREFRKVKISFE